MGFQDYRTQLKNRRVVSVKDYPYLAKGDGITLEYEIVQQAIDDAYDAGLPVYLPERFNIGNNTLEIPLNQIVEGAGFGNWKDTQSPGIAQSTIISSAGTAIKIMSPALSTVNDRYGCMKNIMIKGPGWDENLESFVEDSVGISFGGGSNAIDGARFQLENIYINGFEKAIINTPHAYILKFLCCNFQWNGYGAYFTGQFNSGENLSFVQCLFADNAYGDVYTDGVTTSFYGCSFDYSRWGSDDSKHSAAFTGLNSSVKCFGCHFEKHVGPIVEYPPEGTAGSSVGFIFNGCIFLLTGSNPGVGEAGFIEFNNSGEIELSVRDSTIFSAHTIPFVISVDNPTSGRNRISFTGNNGNGNHLIADVVTQHPSLVNTNISENDSFLMPGFERRTFIPNLTVGQNAEVGNQPPTLIINKSQDAVSECCVLQLGNYQFQFDSEGIGANNLALKNIIDFVACFQINSDRRKFSLGYNASPDHTLTIADFTPGATVDVTIKEGQNQTTDPFRVTDQTDTLRFGCTKEGYLALRIPHSIANSAWPGTVGDITFDGSYIYVCVAPDTWKRAAINSW